jgi:hypothetical protein
MVTDEPLIPVSKERLRICLEDAEYWATALGPFSRKLQAKADCWSTAGVTLSALTAGSLWSALSTTSARWAQVLVGAIAVASAGATAWPRARNYGGGATEAAKASAVYGRVYGELLDALNGNGLNGAQLQEIVARYQQAKTQKDAIHPQAGSHELQKIIEREMAKTLSSAQQSKRKPTARGRLMIWIRKFR